MLTVCYKEKTTDRKCREAIKDLSATGIDFKPQNPNFDFMGSLVSIQPLSCSFSCFGKTLCITLFLS